jgi:DNA transformation protein
MEQIEGFGPASAKRMFGGAGLFREGLMFALVADDVLYFKVDDETTAAYEAEGLAPFTYLTSTGEKRLTSYRNAPARCLDDPDEMAYWAHKAFTAATHADAAKPKSKRKRITDPRVI